MKKLSSSILVLFLLFSSMFMVNENVDATSGRLQGASITTCNGATYGKHSNHWHYAQRRGSYYYASGPQISKPCGKAKKKKTSSYSNYTAGNTAKKAVANNKVKNADKSNKDQADKEKDDIDKDVATSKEDESTTPEVSNFTDADKKSKDADKDSDAVSSFVSTLAGIIIIGFGGRYVVKKRRNKKKKDDLTNW